MQVTRLFDVNGERLIYLGQGATDAFWDKQWETFGFENLKKNKINGFVVSETRRYLPEGAKVLEGGCGAGDKVNSLQLSGYQAVGLDFAEATVKRIRELKPGLNVVCGDVRSLPFPSESFDGYWSLGVIEHFWHGYDDIKREMKRVLKPGGKLFLTVPAMSALRRWKASNGAFEGFSGTSQEPAGFYQFAMDPEALKRDFMHAGFRLKKMSGYDGVKGLKDETADVPILGPATKFLYNNQFFATKIARRLAEPILRRWAFHCAFFVFEKE